MNVGLLFSLLAAIAALVYGVVLIVMINKKATGNKTMQEIAQAIISNVINKGIVFFNIIWT